jgi:hypothetical protein
MVYLFNMVQQLSHKVNEMPASHQTIIIGQLFLQKVPTEELNFVTNVVDTETGDLLAEIRSSSQQISHKLENRW